HAGRRPPGPEGRGRLRGRPARAGRRPRPSGVDSPAEREGFRGEEDAPARSARPQLPSARSAIGRCRRRSRVRRALGGTTATRASAVLDKLQLRDRNPGACTGPNGWIDDPAGEDLVSHNPATGEAIATVKLATLASYD